ncbi:protein arginine N-methyltransferase 1 [Drosophila santomea]|uniref:protein arginine N-methyltransferase 1 n=1 Tax=Drosophila santomea TaxID=129105 RepID=UPI001954BAD3|nr:protein arginine N-methyltransferase 1 [Drosophila santomea]
MTENKSTNLLNQKNKTISARNKPLKLSLADFHNQLDNIQTTCNRRMEDKTSAENWKTFLPISDGLTNGTRGRGVSCKQLPIISQKVEHVIVQNGTPTKTRGGFPSRVNSVANGKKHAEKSNKSKSKTSGKPSDTKITLLRRPNQQDASQVRSKTRVRSFPRIPTPPRNVPKELENLDRMTSADFRHDNAARLDIMRSREKDQEHMHFFQSVLYEQRELIKDRTILVLCCGTGTLALMAARMGAKRVYAVDYSKVTGYATLVVRQNGYEGVVSVLNGRMKDLKLPSKVDGIICNWMGHCLLYESEILEVLEARDRWLKKGGFILPDLGSLYLVASEEHKLKSERCNHWRNVYGFNMNAIRRYALAEPCVALTTGEKLLTMAHCILRLNLKNAKKEDLFIDRNIRLSVTREGYLECFLLFFEVQFSSSLHFKLTCNPCFKTPFKSLWMQTVLFVEQPFVMRKKLHYTGNLKFKALKPNNFKEMEIRIEFYEGREYDEDWVMCTRLVAKRWLMLEGCQTVSDVESCQDEQGENGGQDF